MNEQYETITHDSTLAEYLGDGNSSISLSYDTFVSYLKTPKPEYV